MRRPEAGVRSALGRPGVAPRAGLVDEVPAASVEGSGSRTNRRRGFSRGTKMLPLPLGVALPPRPSTPPAAAAPAACACAAARKSAGERLMRVALMLRRGRMRTPERGVMERGVMRAAGRGGPPASRPAGRCVKPTLYSGAGETCRGGREGSGWWAGGCGQRVGEVKQRGLGRWRDASIRTARGQSTARRCSTAYTRALHPLAPTRTLGGSGSTP